MADYWDLRSKYYTPPTYPSYYNVEIGSVVYPLRGLGFGLLGKGVDSKKRRKQKLLLIK
jgi:hypothetical protein